MRDNNGCKIVIYTDGACRGNHADCNVGAWAYRLEYGDKVKEGYMATRNTTNNIQEMTAIIEALKCIKLEWRNIRVEVMSDSNYCINGITKWRHNWKRKNWKKSDGKPVENLYLWVELDKLLSTFSNIDFIKVKGHSGHKGNERVDYLCNYAMDNLK